MTAVILAAGLSKRFGGKKLIAPLNGSPMLSHVVRLVAEIEFHQRVLVYSDEQILAGLDTRGFTLVRNPQPERGLSSSIKLGLAGIQDDVLFFLGDMPLVTAEAVSLLLGAFSQQKGSIVVPVYDGRRGNPVVFDQKWLPALRALEGDTGGREILRQNSHAVREIAIADTSTGLDFDTRKALNEYIGNSHSREEH